MRSKKTIPSSSTHLPSVSAAPNQPIHLPWLHPHPLLTLSHLVVRTTDGVSDLLSLGDFNEGALLHTIRERHSQQKIYTSIGSPILISVNPFQRLNIFNTTFAQKYRAFAQSQRSGGNEERPEPHLFMVAEDSFQDLMIDGNN